jgi:hypothetical protein
MKISKYLVPVVAYWLGGMTTLLIDVYAQCGDVPIGVVLRAAQWPYVAIRYFIGI